VRRRLAISAVALLVLIGVAAGAKIAKDRQAERERIERAEAQAKESAKRRARARAKAMAEYRDCTERLSGFLDELDEINSRLAIGLNYGDYLERLADVSVSYGKISMGDDVECLTGVGVPAEAAFNQHIKAKDKWSACVDDIDCDTDSIDNSLQTRWSKASQLTDEAKSGLEEMRPTQ
jgi:hypothetical protein